MEQELIIAAKKGNSDAFGKLVKIYSKRIYYASYYILKNVDEASDIVQDVFFKAYEKIDTFQLGFSFYPWLHRIAKNLCLNRLKSKDFNHNELPDYDIEGKFLTPESEYFRQDEAKQLWKAINSLSEDSKEILILKHFQNCSYDEISDILSIPKGTVMSRLFNARRKLKEILIEEGAYEM